MSLLVNSTVVEVFLSLLDLQSHAAAVQLHSTICIIYDLVLYTFCLIAVSQIEGR